MNVSVVKYRQIIVKYRSTQISKVFDKYRQISSRFMTYSIEFQMLSEDAASKITTQVTKKSVMNFQFKNIVLKINHTESKKIYHLWKQSHCQKQFS